MAFVFARNPHVIEFTMLPDDAAWMDAKLRSIEAVLAKPQPEWPAVNAVDDQGGLARRELTDLSTTEALDLAFRDARKRGSSPDALALVATRYRAQAIMAYDRYLADRTTHVHEWHIRLRALFTFLDKESPKHMPVHVWQMRNDSAGWDKVHAEAEARLKRFDDFRARGPELRVWSASMARGESALRRLNELSPQEMYRIVSDDVASGNLRFADFSFHENGERDTPEADAAFSKWLTAGEHRSPSSARRNSLPDADALPVEAVAVRGGDHLPHLLRPQASAERSRVSRRTAASRT